MVTAHTPHSGSKSWKKAFLKSLALIVASVIFDSLLGEVSTLVYMLFGGVALSLAEFRFRWLIVTPLLCYLLRYLFFAAARSFGSWALK